MKRAACCCNCGNISANGQILPPGAAPNIPPTERRFFSGCRQIFLIRSKTIVVRDIRNLQARMLSPTTADLCCSCGTIFRFYCGRGYSYFSKLTTPNNGTPNTNSATQISTAQIPHILAPLISHNSTQPKVQIQFHPQEPSPENTQINNTALNGNEDTDFDLMFSSKIDPIVGSYKQQIGLFGEETLGNIAMSDFMPKSYYA